LCVGFCG